MIPFLLTWVRRFFARFPGRSRRDLGRVEIEAFLSEMARRKDISNSCFVAKAAFADFAE